MAQRHDIRPQRMFGWRREMWLSGAGRGHRYAPSRWARLTLFLKDGRVEIDNSTVERAIQPLALARIVGGHPQSRIDELMPWNLARGPARLVP